MLLAVQVEVAIPLALVVAVEGEQVALAPVLGATKTTLALAIAVPPPSRTLTSKALVNAVPTVVLCGVPAFVAIVGRGVVVVSGMLFKLVVLLAGQILLVHILLL